MALEEALRNIAAFIPDTLLHVVGVGGLDSAADPTPGTMNRLVYEVHVWNPGATTLLTIYELVGSSLVAMKDQFLLTQNTDRQLPQAGPQAGLPVYRFRSSSFIAVQLSSIPPGTTSGMGVDMLIADKPGGA